MAALERLDRDADGGGPDVELLVDAVAVGEQLPEVFVEVEDRVSEPRGAPRRELLD